MIIRFLCWVAIGGFAGAVLGGMVGKGDWQAPLFVGAFGVVLGIVAFAVVSFLHRMLKVDESKTNRLAIVGACIGSVVGAFIGAATNLGRPMIAFFNPDLPEMDFLVSFGAIGGFFIGAVAGACLFSATGGLFRPGKTRELGSKESDSDQQTPLPE